MKFVKDHPSDETLDLVCRIGDGEEPSGESCLARVVRSEVGECCPKSLLGNIFTVTRVANEVLDHAKKRTFMPFDQNSK